MSFIVSFSSLFFFHQCDNSWTHTATQNKWFMTKWKTHFIRRLFFSLEKYIYFACYEIFTHSIHVKIKNVFLPFNELTSIHIHLTQKHTHARDSNKIIKIVHRTMNILFKIETSFLSLMNYSLFRIKLIFQGILNTWHTDRHYSATLCTHCESNIVPERNIKITGEKNFH